MKRLCVVTAVPVTVNAFLMEHINILSRNYEVTIVTSMKCGDAIELPKNTKLHSMLIQRDIKLFDDFKALVKLWSFFRVSKFDAIISVTPKAGLFAALAGYFTNTTLRIHWFTGQVWATKSGLRRYFLKIFDKIIVRCCTNVLVDSPSQLEFLIEEKILKRGKGCVLGKGSICGVNVERFKFDKIAHDALRDKLKILPQHKVILFLGRLNRDKGVFDLLDAFIKLENKRSDIHLVFVGPDEEDVEGKLILQGKIKDKIHFIGKTSEPEKWYSIADVFCLPSYREGFGSSIIEAAAIGVPSVVSRIYGLTDAVVEGETGLMHSVSNVHQMEEVLNKILSDDVLRYMLGENAKKRVETFFRQEYISNLFIKFVSDNLKG